MESINNPPEPVNNSCCGGQCYGSSSTSVGCKIHEKKFQFESNPEFMKGRFVPVDLNSSYDKHICEVLSNLAISTHNDMFKRHRPARELVNVVEAKARNFEGKILFKLFFEAIELCEGGLQCIYESFATHGAGTNELVTLMHKPRTDPPDLVRPRPMTFEQRLTYDDEIKSSDGFDVTATPGFYSFGMIQPVDLSIKCEKDECMEFARFAIDAFNAQVKDSKEKLQLDELVKAMHQGVHGVLYYLTFTAINLHNRAKITCQAIVHSYSIERNDVLCFRLKPSDYERGSHIGQWVWVWDKRECGCRDIQGV